MNKVILPITINIPTSSYFALSLQLSVILAHNETQEWYYENFINIYMERHSGNICFTDMSFGMLCRYTTVFDYSVSKYEDTAHENIVNRIRHELLNEHNYTYLYIDEYYISCQEAYMNYHFHHQSLIYGFDDEQQILHAIAFDKSGHFAKLEYKYDEIIIAYSEAFKCAPETKNDTFGAVFFKIRPDFSHKLNLSHVLYTLSEYINGCIPKNLHYVQHNMPHTFFCQDFDCSFGMEVIKRTANFFNNLDPKDYTFVDFRRIHFLYEHSTMLLERFQYIGKRFACDSAEYEKLLEQYKNITQKHMTIRLVFMKMLLLYNNNINFSINEFNQKIQRSLFDIYHSEKQVIAEIIRYLSSKQSQCIDYSNSYNVLSQAIIRQKQNNLVEIEFKTPYNIEILTFNCISDIKIYINNNYYDSFYHFSSLNKTTSLAINQSVQTISFESVSGNQMCYCDLEIRLTGGNILLGKKITSSSVWHRDGGNRVDQNCLPENAIDGDKNSYWRAAEQKNGYDGSDWLEVDLGEAEIINTVVIDELDYSPRLKRYTLYYTDEKYQEVVLLTHDFSSGAPNVHQFPNITAKKIKIVFEECTMERNGHFEPIVSIFAAYRNNNYT